MSHTGDIDLNKLLSSFQPLTRKSTEAIGNPNAEAAQLEIGYPAVARNNANALHLARAAAGDRNLPNQFPCFRLLFSDQTQGFLMIPEATYVETNPELYQVRWNKDGRTFSVDLSQALVYKHWGVPVGYLRKASVSLHRDVQKTGTVLYVDLKNSTVGPRSKKKKQEQKSDQAVPAAAAKQEEGLPK